MIGVIKEYLLGILPTEEYLLNKIVFMKKERLIALINSIEESERKKYGIFSEITGIKRETLKNLCAGKQRFNDEHLDAIAATFPQYKMWFAFGDVIPEIGQISPELDKIVETYEETGMDTQ